MLLLSGRRIASTTMYQLLRPLILVAVARAYHPENIPYNTKTPYNMTETDWNVMLKPHIPSHFSLVYVNAVLRHGTRHPGKKKIKKMIATRNKLRALQVPLPTDGLKALLNWEDPYDEDVASKALVKRGQEEHIFLGKDYANLLTQFRIAGRVTVATKATRKDRTKDSCAAFVEGFKTIHQDADIPKYPVVDDTLLRFFDNCENYDPVWKESEAATANHQEFLKGEVLSTVSSELHEILKLSPDTLTVDELESILRVGQVEDANFDKSPLLYPFTKEHQKAFEYLDDLEEWWVKGYGNPITYKQACPLFQDIFSHLDKAADGGYTDFHAQFQFGHSETVLPLVSLLKFFYDGPEAPLTADAWDTLGQNRKWTTSRHTPAAANLAVLLWKDGDGVHHISVMVNNVPMKLLGGDRYHVPLQDAKNHFSEYLNSCVYEEVCAVPGSLTARVAVSTLLLATATVAGVVCYGRYRKRKAA